MYCEELDTFSNDFRAYHCSVMYMLEINPFCWLCSVSALLSPFAIAADIYNYNRLAGIYFNFFATLSSYFRFTFSLCQIFSFLSNKDAFERNV